MVAKRKKAGGKPWKKGESGNPVGRPPKVRCIADLLQKIGDEEIEKVMEGRKHKMTKMEAVLRVVFAHAVKGQAWAVNYIADRTEGKPKQSIGLQADLTVRFEMEDKDL